MPLRFVLTRLPRVRVVRLARLALCGAVAAGAMPSFVPVSARALPERARAQAGAPAASPAPATPATPATPPTRATRATPATQATPATRPAAPVAASPVVIPAGEFWMGRTRLWLMDEIGWQIRERFDDRPVHRVRLDAFAIDAHEVTNAAYAAFAATPASGVAPPYHWGGTAPPPGKERLPVYNVTWFEAAKYCAARGQRLPTEAEWERAARGGVADLDYPWGNDYADDIAATPKPAAVQPPGATIAASQPAAPAAGQRTVPGPRPGRHAHSGSSTGPVPVGTYPPNALGLYDVSGNLWEWTADWYDLHYYSESPVENPAGPATGLYKVIRGGSWADTETRLGTVYYRNFTAPATAQPTIGFRCAGPAPALR